MTPEGWGVVLLIFLVLVLVLAAWCAEGAGRLHSGVPVRNPHPYPKWHPGYRWRHQEHDPW